MIEMMYFRIEWSGFEWRVIPVVLRGKKKIQCGGSWPLEVFLNRR